MKEPGQIAYEAWSKTFPLGLGLFENAGKTNRDAWAAVEAAVRAAALEEAAKRARLCAGLSGVDTARAIRALIPSLAAPSSPLASDQSEPPPGSTDKSMEE